MGCCFSKEDEDGNGNGKDNEMEMKGLNENDPMLSISSDMSSPTIQIEDNNTISGYGLALACVNIEQDAAYWEVHIINDNNNNNSIDIYVGLSTKKNQKSYNADLNYDEIIKLSNDFDIDNIKNKFGLEYMSKLSSCINDDVIGIIIQQSDLPMIQFTKNGEFLDDLSINRFRGTIYPSFFIVPTSTSSTTTASSTTKLKVIFKESSFRQTIPYPHCSPVIVARGLM